jgi:hypothetical protein
VLNRSIQPLSTASNSIRERLSIQSSSSIKWASAQFVREIATPAATPMPWSARPARSQLIKDEKHRNDTAQDIDGEKAEGDRPPAEGIRKRSTDKLGTLPKP